MTNPTDLIARLREGQKYDCESGYPIVMDYIMDEAADAIEAAQAEIERLQTTVKHLSDAAANATFAEKAALARLAELSKQEPVGIVGGQLHGDHRWVLQHGSNVSKGDKLFAAAGASPVQPSQAVEPPRFPTMLRKMWSGGEVQDWINANWNAAINDKESK